MISRVNRPLVCYRLSGSFVFVYWSFAIPRTATVSTKLGLPLLGQSGRLFIFTLVYLAYLIALYPSKILDSTDLTPVFAILIVVLVVLGALKHSGHAPQVATEAY